MKKLIVTSVLLGVIVAMLPTASIAQTITTIAGCGIGDDSLATRAELNGPVGIARDNFGNTYIGEDKESRVRKVDAAGVITTFAGTGTFGYSGDGGPATAANIGDIYGVAIDRKGNVYIVDVAYSCIRKIDTSGIISTIAGTGYAGYSGDNGPATAAELYAPTDIVVGSPGNIIFADYQNYRVRKIDTAGIITTIAGDGQLSGSGNGGPATASELGEPFRVTMDKKGNLYIGYVNYSYICKVDTAGIITVIAGTGAYETGADGDNGPATAATMTAPWGLLTDTSGNLYFSDTYNGRIRKIDMNTGIISAYAATGVSGFSGDGGPATAAQMSQPEALLYDTAGNLFVCDDDNNRVREINTAGAISTFAGQNGLFEEGYNAANAELYLPANLATDTAGNIYIADYYNNRVRKINAATGIITTVAGSGIAGHEDPFSGDGEPATLANMYNPVAVAVDDSGNIYVADIGNQRVRKVNSLGIITTIAGNGAAGYTGDNHAAITSELNEPSGVAVDLAGNVYIADAENNRIRKVNSAGIISTIAGNGTGGYNGDDGPATAASIYYPSDVTVDNTGNIYMVDEGNSCIRKVDTAGIITTVAGMGIPGFAGDGDPATDAYLEYPASVKIDNEGNIYIADEGNERIRMVNTSGIITTIAGDGTQGFNGDGGSAINALLNNPAGVAVDHSGNVYISDGGNNRIRKVTLPLSVPTVNAAAMNVSVYPNPTIGAINIINAANCNAVMYDAVGKEVMRRSIAADQQTFDISGFASGIYILQVTNSNGANQMIKIVKE